MKLILRSVRNNAHRRTGTMRHYRTLGLTAFIGILGLVSLSPRAHAQFVEFNEPESVYGTSAYGINGTVIVGSFNDVNNITLGYTYDIASKVFTKFVGPDGLDGFGVPIDSVELRAKSGGTLVGDFTDALGQHGLVYSGGVYTPFDAFGAPYSVPTVFESISGTTIVGHTNDFFFGDQSFTYDYVGNSWNAVVDPFSAGPTDAYGIEGSQIVGSIIDATSFNTTGFWYDGSSYNEILPTGAITSVCKDIFGGVIAGSYSTDGVTTHGFLYNTATGLYTTVDDPNAGVGGSTVLDGIGAPIDPRNPTYSVVGYYSSPGGNSVAFEWQEPVPEPGSMALFAGAGLAGLAAVRRRRRNK